jgi:glycosyltransferase involved in cell wall biosynthesis
MVNGRVIKDDLVEHWGIPPDKIEVVYNGIDVDLFSTPVDAVAKKAELGIPADRVIFGTVATLRPIKGLDVLLRATKQVLERCSHAHLAVVGDGPCRDELVKLAASLGISDRITFCGRREDVSEALTTFDVFVLSSLSEGFPNTVCEALVRGLPVVATDVGGVGEAVIPGETGLLVQPGDAAGLAQAMIRLAGDESLRRSMSGKGRELAVDRFSLRHMIGSIEAVYEDELRKLGVPDRSEHSRYAG